MAIDWMKGFIIPLIEIVFLFGIISFISFYTYKGFSNAWSKSWKFFFKYTIFRRKYPEEIVAWCIQCLEQGIGWYDAKKLMMIRMTNPKVINETLWIYDKILQSEYKSTNTDKTKKYTIEKEITEGKLPTNFNLLDDKQKGGG
jgi:hypothetical protein